MTEQKISNAKPVYFVLIAALVLIIAGALWFLLQKEPQKTTVVDLLPAPVTEPVEVPEAIEPAVTDETQTGGQPEIQPEIAERPTELPEVDEAPLPSLDNADQDIRPRLLALNWKAGLAGLFVTEDMLRNFVVKADNIAQGQLASGHKLLQPLPQTLAIATGEPMQLNDTHFARYEPYIQLLESVPEQQLVALFNRYEPLMQQAYAELGYPDQLFKNTLLQAIDMLLATPEVSYPLALERPSVMYTFADSQIEQLPAAQKQMIRLGPDNQQRVKALLKRYKLALQK